jgi:hypothetical protein
MGLLPYNHDQTFCARIFLKFEDYEDIVIL